MNKLNKIIIMNKELIIIYLFQIIQKIKLIVKIII